MVVTRCEGCWSYGGHDKWAIETGCRRSRAGRRRSHAGHDSRLGILTLP